MPIDPGLQTPENYMTPAQLQAQRAYAQHLMAGQQQEMRSPWQGVSGIVSALMGGHLQHSADVGEQKARQQAAQLLGEKFNASDLSGVIGAASNPYSNPEAIKLAAGLLTPQRVEEVGGSRYRNRYGEPVGPFIPSLVKGEIEAGGAKMPQHLIGTGNGGLVPVPGGNSSGMGAPQPQSGPSQSAPSMPMVRPPQRPGEPMVGEPATAGERIAQGFNSLRELGAVGNDITADKKSKEKQIDIYATKSEHIQKQAYDAQPEISQLQLLQKVMANPRYMSGLFSGEAGTLDQVGKIFGLSSGQTASLQQFAQKLGSTASLEQIREMGQSGAVRVPEMHMIEKSNYDPKNTDDANRAVVDLRLRLAQRSLEMGDFDNNYKRTGNIYGKPGRGSGALDATFDQQVRDHYRDKPMITDQEMARYEALMTGPKGGITAPIDKDGYAHIGGYRIKER